jgi:DNA repair photolyase
MMELKDVLFSVESCVERLEALKAAEEDGFGYHVSCDPVLDAAIASGCRKIRRLCRQLGLTGYEEFLLDPNVPDFAKYDML